MDTNEFVIIPIDVGRKIAVELDLYDISLMVINIQDRQIETQKLQIKSMGKEMSMMRDISNKQSQSNSELYRQIQIWQQMDKKNKGISLGLKILVPVAFIAGVLVAK